MEHRMPWVFLLIFSLFLGSCGLLENDDEEKSGTGDPCTDSTDCQTGLICKNQICVEEETIQEGDEDQQAEALENEQEEEGDGELVWQNPAALDQMKWQAAMDYCEALVLDEFENWRLPTIGELRTLAKGCEATLPGGSCMLNDTCYASNCRNDDCDGCAENEGPEDGCYWQSDLEGICLGYWSSTTVENDEEKAWLFGFGSAVIYYGSGKETYNANVRCVRP